MWNTERFYREDMPQKPLDRVTRITLFYWSRRVFAPAPATRRVFPEGRGERGLAP